MGTRAADAAAELDWMVRASELPVPLREHRFHPERRWRFDLAWPTLLVAVEVDGGAYIGGRHTSGPGFEADCEKMSEAAARGWRVLRVTPRHVHDGKALTWLMAAIKTAQGERDRLREAVEEEVANAILQGLRLEAGMELRIDPAGRSASVRYLHPSVEELGFDVSPR